MTRIAVTICRLVAGLRGVLPMAVVTNLYGKLVFKDLTATSGDRFYRARKLSP